MQCSTGSAWRVGWWWLAILAIPFALWFHPVSAEAQFTHTQLTHTTGIFNANSSPSINADGTRIAFESDRNLTGGNADGTREIFLSTNQAPPPPVTSIPILSEWAQIGMAALFAGGLLLAIRRRSAV